MINDAVNHPQHYQHPSGVECIQITEHMSFLMGNAIKYIWRADSKGSPINDLRKAIWYIEREITRRTDEANTASVVTKSVSSPTEKIGSALAYAQAGTSIADIRLLAAGGDRQAQLYLAQGYAHGWYGLTQSSYMSCLWRSRANEPRTEEDAQ